jgi:Tfp pilus tip-associated adhesin PilY1
VVALGNSVWAPDENCVSDGKGGLVWQGQGASKRCRLEWSAFSSKTDSYDTETDACIGSDTGPLPGRATPTRKAVVGTCQPRLGVPGYGDVYCLGLRFGEAVPVGEPAVNCEASTSGPDASGVTTSIECAALVGKSEYVAECTPDLVADERNQYVITQCTTEFATEKIGDQNVVVRDLEGACVEQAPSGCPTNDPALCWQTSCATTPRPSTPNTLADVAQYYFMTDLRTPELKNCAPNGIGDAEKAGVCGPASSNDVNGQHMLTYTLGLGASGLMQYAEGYPKATPGDGSDFASIKWLTTPIRSMASARGKRAATCDWPPPASDSQTNIDDLWHAAVNGRGTYYSARDPSALAAGISSALADIGTAKGSLAAVTVTLAKPRPATMPLRGLLRSRRLGRRRGQADNQRRHRGDLGT